MIRQIQQCKTMTCTAKNISLSALFDSQKSTKKIKISDFENELKMMKFRIFRYWLRTKGFCSARGETILTFRDMESETSGQFSKKLKNIGMRNIKIKRTMLVTILRRHFFAHLCRPSDNGFIHILFSFILEHPQRLSN